MPRIVVGGIQHESNSFSTLRARMADFVVRRGDDVVSEPFWDAVRADGVEVVGTLLASAAPNGHVEAATYVALRDELLERLRRALPADGVYLALHGAMEVDEIGDGESNLVAAVREVVGPDVPVVASLDLHGNLAPRLTRGLDAMTAYRTAPHRDQAETRARAVRLLRQAMAGRRPITAMVKLPILVAGESAVTEVEPARSLYALLPEISSRPGVLDASLMIACAWTDSPYTSVSTLVVAQDRATAEREARDLARIVWERRAEFRPDAETASVDEAIRRAMDAPESTVFISDSGDNVTAGAAGDSPLFVERLLAANAQNAVVAGLIDPAAVAACTAAGAGASVAVELGGKLDALNFRPFSVTGTVERLGDGVAVLRSGGTEIVLAASRRWFTTFRDFAEVGIDPLARKIVVVKLGYLFPELRDHAPRAILALSPGFTDLQLDRLHYRRVVRPIFPLDADAAWVPTSA
jgi:microcystin degradation protein MlrC